MAKAPPESEIEDSGNNKTYDFNSPPQSFACPGGGRGGGGGINLNLRLTTEARQPPKGPSGPNPTLQPVSPTVNVHHPAARISNIP